MADSCDPGYDDGFVFPRRPANRPALPHIGYRIGAYPDFVEAMVRQINASLPLGGWTHRGADDPGIALLEGAAILGDILTFYQEHYANEAFLRTATWRQSVAELVRLLGYRLAPGLGGRTTFAFKVKGTQPLVIPAGFPLKADLRDVPDPADFQTAADLTAYPWLSAFRLYRPRKPASGIDAGATRVELAIAGGRTSLAGRQMADLKKGDRLMLVPPEPPWTHGAGTLAEQQAVPQVLKVAKITTLLDRLLIEFETAVASDWTGNVTAYRVGRTFRHFGHNAPPKVVSSITSGNTITGSEQWDTAYERHVFAGHDCTYSSAVGALPARRVPLDQEVSDLAVNADLILQCALHEEGKTPSAALTVVRRIAAIAGGTQGFGNLNGATSFVTLDQALVHDSSLARPLSDIRDWRLHEVTSPKLQLRGETGFDNGTLTSGTKSLWFFGTAAQAKPLADRRLLLEADDGRQLELHCTATGLAPTTAAAPAATGFVTGIVSALQGAGASFAKAPVSKTGPAFIQQGLSIQAASVLLGTVAKVSALATLATVTDPDAAIEPRMWSLSFDTVPDAFRREDFDEAAPRVTVSGNLADATQGQAERPAVLGNGDGRARFQTFKLPKAPLTYLLSDAATPPQVPEIHVRVNGREWLRVASLFGRGPLEEIYIVREDADGASWVQFGDGETGARLPSGVGNVGVEFRSGVGAHGPAKPGAKPSAGQRLEGLDEVRLPGVVGGGAQPEDADKARDTAPGKVQSLGRLVSLRDFETEARSIPGVITATAAWGLKDHVPTVLLRVLLEAGREAEFEQVRATLAHFQRCRGPDRYPVAVEEAFLRYVFADVLYSADPRLKKEDVEAGLRDALGLAGIDATARSGLFGLHARRLGEPEYASRVEGVLQQVPGIAWCKLTAFGAFASGSVDPLALDLPAPPRVRLDQLVAPERELLQLHPRHLALASAPPPTQECA